MPTLILLSDVRDRVFRWWMSGSVLLLGLFILQAVNGKYAGIEGLAWGWLGGVVLPGLVMLCVAVWLNQSPAKLLHPGTFRTLLVVAGGYVLLVLVVLVFSQHAIEANEYGLDTYLRRSLFFLLPFELLTLAGFWLVFFKKENRFRPDPEVIAKFAGEKATASSQAGLLQQARIYALIAANDLPGAFDLLRTFFQEKNEQENANQIILLQGEYTGLQQSRNLNLIEPDAAQRQLNRMVAALLSLANQVDV